MKSGFYSRLALDGMRKNRRLYLPYLLTCIMMVTMYYIMVFLTKDKLVETMEGGSNTILILNLGCYVIAFFALIFLFYTNAFLIRRRKKEFGLYNVLGMDKHSLGKILFFETGITAVVSLVFGLLAGIGVSKLAELGLINTIGGEVSYQFAVPVEAVRNTVLLFGAIFLLLFFNTLRQVRFGSAMELVRSENVGEKPPKANWILGVAGAVILGSAYALTVSIEEPMAALIWFFVAVIMVIIATYLLFIAGSVFLCRILQKNKNYYYKPQHFVSVSSMAYRMKRNGAGLASICILLTMVLVMISSSACLYIGAEDCLDARYPKDVCASISGNGYQKEGADAAVPVLEEIKRLAKERNVSLTEEREYREYCITGYFKDSYVDISLTSKSEMSLISYNNVAQVHFVSLEDYNRIFGKSEKLLNGEALIYTVKTKVPGDTLKVGEESYKVRQITENSFDLDGASEASPTGNIFLVVPNLSETVSAYKDCRDYNGNPMLQWNWLYQFNTDISSEATVNLAEDIEAIMDSRLEGEKLNYYNCASHEGQRGDFYGTFGSLFFLGILLSVVFLTAAVLIIYYKQISEGYEDQSRFEIMQKVGMTKRDIKRSINSQMLLVFFLPMLLAVLHIGFAFPVIHKLLMLFALFNLPLLIATTGVSILICALFYTVVYRVTSNAYYSIVSSAR